MNNTLQKAVFKHGYTIIIAAWLFTISFVITNYWAFYATPNKVQQNFTQYLTQQEQKFEKLVDDRASVALLINSFSDKTSLQLKDADLGIFVFEHKNDSSWKETYWSTFSMSLDSSDFLSISDGYFAYYGRNGFFELLKKTFVQNNQTYVIAGLIPIKWQYFIESNNFRNTFANSPKLNDLYSIDTTGNGYPVYNSKDQIVFRISPSQGNTSGHLDMLSISFRLAAIIFLLIFVNSIINEVTIARGFYVGLFWLLLTITALRTFTYITPGSFSFRSYNLFSPLIYASNTFHSSLGDLLINALLFFWITFFIKYRHGTLSKGRVAGIIHHFPKTTGAIGLALFTFFTFSNVDIICGLVLDSKIPLNVTDFFHLNIYTFVTFFILTFVVLSYFNLSYFLLLPVNRAKLNMPWRIAVMATIGLVMLSIHHETKLIPLYFATILWIVLYFFILRFRERDLSRPLVGSPYFLFWLMFYAASITLVIRAANNRDLEDRKQIADALALQADNAGENLLKMSISNLSNIFLQQNFIRMYAPRANYHIKDSLVTANFSGFLRKYEPHIFTFDSLQQPLNNKDSAAFGVLNTIVGTKSKPTNTPDLYVYETGDNTFNYIYRKRIEVDNGEKVLGYLFMVVNPRRFAGSSLATEILNSSSLLPDDPPKKYGYAIYKNKRLINSSQDYEFSDSIDNNQVPAEIYKEVNDRNKKELWFNAGNNTVIAVVEDNHDFINTITLFAYLFLSFVILIVLFKIIGFLVQSRFKWRLIREAFQFTIRFQIHATIIFISVFSFLIIGASTISFFILRFDKSTQEKLAQNIQIMANEVQEGLTTELPFDLKTPNGIDNFYSSDPIEKRVIELADLNKQDVNLYSLSGQLKASSQPYIFNRNIVSNRMHPEAFYQLHFNHRIKYIQQENIGNLQYLSGYMPLYNKEKKVFAYLNMPFLNSQNELEQEISSFLVTIINLNALIFLLAGAIASLLTARITQSFSLIKEEMRAINLGIENNIIAWNHKDEIGGLVKEYNIMVQKLNESVKALAKSEREGAWKEMARQVAHEIKNPLTPMKLSLQFLQRAAESGKTNIREMATRIPTMLIEQIDQLAKIAGDFSQFANIHNIHPERYAITESISAMVMLYRTSENIKIHYDQPTQYNYVFADKTQINRVFTNLIKNAIEASEHKTMTEIFIMEETVGGQVLVSIKDHGAGISPDESAKIFTPNFTTKTSGTGLGLAICKGIVERADGQIWFESILGEGTTFYVSLPLSETGEV